MEERCLVERLPTRNRLRSISISITVEQEQAKITEAAYSKVSIIVNAALQFRKSPTNTPCIARWHLVADKMMNGIKAVESAAATAFLTTTGTDYRNLILRGCCAVSQCRGNRLDPAGRVAWAKVAVAADPK
jgi:hypothetical protein